MDNFICYRRIRANAPLSSLILSQPPAPSSLLKLRQASPSMWHVCTCNPFLFLSCSINLCVQPDVGRESCIPNTKNNHFSRKGCVWVQMSRGGRVGEYSQLTGMRLNCSYSRRRGRMAMKGAIYFLQTLLPENVCCSKCGIPFPLLCTQSWPGAEQLRGDFYFLFQSIAFKEHAHQTASNIIDLQAGNTLKQISS